MTKITIQTIKAVTPQDKDQFIWDSEVKGFGIKVSPHGKITFVAQARPGGRGTNPIRVTIGTYPVWKPEAARDQAANELFQIKKDGVNPKHAAAEKKKALEQAEQAAAEREFSKVAESYLTKCVRAKLADAPQIERIIQRQFLSEWTGKDVRDITMHVISERLEEVAEVYPAAAHKALRTIRPLLQYAVKKGWITVNPASGLTLSTAPKMGDRHLTDPELREVWAAANSLGYPFGPFFQLLILTGQRRNEVAQMEWAEIDWEKAEWTIPKERTKNGKQHVVHLSPCALKILEGCKKGKTFVFTTRYKKPDGITTTEPQEVPISGFSKAKAKLDKLILEARQKAQADAEAMAPWKLHDLRRTFSTGGARLGSPLDIIERVLNHLPTALQGVAQVYQLHEFLEQRRKAMFLWSEYVVQLIAQAETG